MKEKLHVDGRLPLNRTGIPGIARVAAESGDDADGNVAHERGSHIDCFQYDTKNLY